MDNIKASVDRLSELSDDEIVALEGEMIGTFDTFAEADRSVESVDAMTELASLIETVRGEIVGRKAAAEQREAAVSELSARVHGTEAESAPEAEASGFPFDKKEDDESSDEDDEDDKDEPVVASAETEETPAPAEDDSTATEASVVEVPTEADAPETIAETEAAAEVEAPAEAAVEEIVVEAPVEAEAAIVETTLDEQEAAQEEAQTVTASAEETFEAPAGRRPEAQVTEAPVAIVAGADIPGVPAGSPVNDMKGVATLFTERLRTFNRGGGDGDQALVASFLSEYDEARTLDRDAERNAEKIGSNGGALVAAGGYGTPLPQAYEIFSFDHTSNRPVKDLLPKFAANRGGISYIEPPVLGDYATSAYGAASGIWTKEMDAAAANNDGDSGDVLKNVLIVQGAQIRTADLYAVTLQLQIGNLLARAYPELVERHNELALVQHARLAEKTLLSKIDAGSTQVTQAQVLGFARDFITTVRRAAIAYRSRHRLAKGSVLDAIIPDWVYDAVANDLTMNMPGDDNLSVGRAEIDAHLRDSGVRLTGSPDLKEFTAQGTGALSAWPATFEWYLFSPGTWTFLDGGKLDLGIIRDSALVSTNDYRMFVESFEGVAKMGIESLAITSTFKVNGAASALVAVS